MTQRWTMNRLWAAWWAAALVLGLGAEATAQGLTYEGVLTDLDNQPINETLAMSFSLFPQEDGGEALWTEAQEVEVSDGTFTVILGKVEPLPEDPPAGLFLELTIDEDVQSPRTPVAGTLYAVRAQVADDVPGRDITPRTVSIDGVGPVIDEEGRWVGAVNTTDSDNDGFLDVVEMAVGTNPEDAQSVPEDLDEDGVPDQLKGAVGPAGPQGEQGEAGPEGPPGINGLDSNPGAVADELLINNQFLLQIAQLMVDNHQEQLRGAPGADADPEAVAAALALDDAFRAALAEYLVNNFADDLRGPPGEGGQLSSPVLLGEVVPGQGFESLDTPATIPDNNEFGFSSARFVNEDITIERITVDVDIEHPNMGELTIILFSPNDTQVILYEGNDANQANLVTNFGRDTTPVDGRLEHRLFGQSTAGLWRLQLIDGGDGNVGTLNSWRLNINETWAEGEIFVGEKITSAGEIVAEGELRTDMGADFVMVNSNGVEVFRIDGETGHIPNRQGRGIYGVTRTQIGDPLQRGEVYSDTFEVFNIVVPANSFLTISGDYSLQNALWHRSNTTRGGIRLVNSRSEIVPFITAYGNEVTSISSTRNGASGCLSPGTATGNVDIKAYFETTETISVVSFLYYTACSDSRVEYPIEPGQITTRLQITIQ